MDDHLPIRLVAPGVGIGEGWCAIHEDLPHVVRVGVGDYHARHGRWCHTERGEITDYVAG